MSRVWVVAGFVLVGTGVSLAAFGAWLIGNANCDASDLGRACVSASLGTAAVGAALALGGWLRARRLGGGDEGKQREGAGALPLAAILAVAIVGILLVPVLNPAPAVPVDVFARPAPAPGAAPDAFLPPALAGTSREFLVVADGERNHSVVALATYAGGITARVTRFNVTVDGPGNTTGNATGNGTGNATANITLDEARAAARGYLDALYVGLDRAQGRTLCGSPSGPRWFVQEAPGGSTLVWQRENFVVQVTAPTPEARDRAAGALAL
ncbi:MAG TPA: hypothetical protein VGB42_09370 [Candidatus Thermoplasmatota archaeon]